MPKFVVVRSEGPDHKKEFEVEVFVRNAPAGRGRGSSKKEAEQQAASSAYEAIGAMVTSARETVAPGGVAESDDAPQGPDGTTNGG